MNFNEMLTELENIEISSSLGSLSETIEQDKRKLFNSDLSKIPYRYKFLPTEFFNHINFPESSEINTYSENSEKCILPKEMLDTLGHLNESLKIDRQTIYKALTFPTRPFNLTELYLIDPSLLSNKDTNILRYLILLLRGYSISENMPFWNRIDNIDTLVLYKNDSIEKVKIAVTSFEVKSETFMSMITQTDDPDTTRYNRISNLLNEILRCDVKPDYVILPELAIPTNWFMSFAKMLQKKGICLISGVEYLHKKDDNNIVHNQVWSALSHDGLDFPSYIIYKQDKTKAAYNEEKVLCQSRQKEIKAEKPWDNPPIIQHGDFYFSELICSQLTNIKYRSYLRGKVDALFLPEWNRDLTSFNALVESSALDIHAYIIQCNNRAYGDSRIRAPFKEDWKRDIVRVKGGCNDYFVVGEIDIDSLKRFQSDHRPSEKTFKPFPDGFNEDMDESRKRPSL